MLYILTGIWVLGTQNAGQNMLYLSFCMKNVKQNNKIEVFLPHFSFFLYLKVGLVPMETTANKRGEHGLVNARRTKVLE